MRLNDKLHAHPLSFDEEQTKQIDRCLLQLADHIAAPLVMLADVSGRLILYRGRLPASQSTGLAALAAASFAASTEIGNFLGLPKGFKQQLHEGSVADLYTIAVGPELLLIIAFTKQTMLGMVRLFATQTQQELLQLAQKAAKAREEATHSAESVDRGFAKEVTEQLDDLFLADVPEAGVDE